MSSSSKVINEFKSLIVDYFVKEHYEDILNILKASASSNSYSILLDFFDLIGEVGGLNEVFFTDSSSYLRLIQACVQDAQGAIIKENLDLKLTQKPKVTVRLHSLPCAAGIEVQLPRSMHSNKFVTFNGTVTKTFEKRCIFTKQLLSCVKCGHEFSVDIDFSYVDLFLKPNKCPNEDCKSDKFTAVDIETKPAFKSSLSDYQELKVQEKLDIMSMGTVPKSVVVIVENDLVNLCKPGDDITINGLVLRQWNKPEPNMRCEIEIIMHANYIKVNNEQQVHSIITDQKKIQFENFWKQFSEEPFRARNIILTVSLVLTGGVSRKDQDGIRTRGESHLLLVGDPGTGKSQILKYASKILPRGINTTGMGSTSAGLTATASREGGQWHLEPGALVLADGGICCIDEFNCMKNDDKNSMLEAMEQQTISVAKAGIVCNLKTQCSILAACNPKGRYDSNEPVTVNLGLPSPLLSRFDVVLLLMDTPNEQWDHAASTYLLEGIDLMKKNNRKKRSSYDTVDDEKPWPFQDLRVYINYVKSFEPKINENANHVIQEYYVQQRNMPDTNKARTTTRMLESIIRLSQAHAKLMYRKEVLVMDAIVAISLMESSLDQSSLFNSVNILHTSFSDEPEREYIEQAEMILTRLKLRDIFKEEREMYDACFDTATYKDSLNREMTFTQSKQDKSDASYLNETQTEKIIKPTDNNRFTRKQTNDVQNVPSQKSNITHVSLASKRKFIEEETLISSSLDSNLTKKPKTINSLISVSQAPLVHYAMTSQMISSTQKVIPVSQPKQQTYDIDDLDLDV